MTNPAPKDSVVVTLEPQSFEAEILGGPCFRLACSAQAGAEVIGSEAVALLSWAKANGARLITARISEGRAELIDELERVGFRRIETLVTFERPLGNGDEWHSGGPVSLAQSGDFSHCIQIARSAFETDRFHADARIPKEVADTLKARWVANDLNGRADTSFVAFADGRPAGFNLCLKRDAVAVIDLIAVAPAYRRRGLGKALVLASLAHYAKTTRVMQVGTQANNAASVATYRRFGFHPIAEAATLHWMP